MTDMDAARGQVATDAARVYEEFFVPALFGQWAEIMLDAVSVGRGDRVLDVGCGTGVLARAASRRVGSTGTVVGLDPNAGMLGVASEAPEPVTWETGVAEVMPFPDSSFDRVVSQFVAMFLADAPAAISEMRRVLAPAGSIAIATWVSVDQSPGYAAMVDLLRRVVSDAAADALLAPFSIGTPDALAAALGTAFAGVTVERYHGVARFASVDAWLHTDIRGWTLSGLVDDETYERLRVEAREKLAPFTDDGGAVRFPAPALIATATI